MKGTEFIRLILHWVYHWKSAIFGFLPLFQILKLFNVNMAEILHQWVKEKGENRTDFSLWTELCASYPADKTQY